MKRIIYCIALCLGISVFVGCSKSTSNIEYIPCMVNENEDWSFVDAKGNIFCQDAFKYRPSFVREGVFTLKEESGYCLYKFDEKKPTIILEDLKSVGVVANGLLPICRPNNKIEIVNVAGETQFTLERINDKPIVACWANFIGDYLVIQDVEEQYGAIDKNGNVILAPAYEFLYPFSKDLFLARQADYLMIINNRGDQVSTWSEEEMENVNTSLMENNCKNEYLVLNDEEGRFSIYNIKGELVIKCPKRVEDILELKDKSFVYESEDGYGVMNLQGERLVNDKYEAITITTKGYLARRDDDHDIEFINAKGELVSKIPDIEKMRVIEGFAIVGVDGDDEYIYNQNLQCLNKDAFYYIPTTEVNQDNVYSDYVDVDYIVSETMHAIGSRLQDLGFVIGNPIQNVPYLKKQAARDYNSNSYNATYSSSLLYSLKLKTIFDRNPTKPVYRNKEVEEYSWLFGYYTTTQKVLDGYVVDNNACIESMVFSIEVEHEKTHAIMNALKAAFSKEFTEYDNNIYLVNDVKCVLEEQNKKITISLSKQ